MVASRGVLVAWCGEVWCGALRFCVVWCGGASWCGVWYVIHVLVGETADSSRHPLDLYLLCFFLGLF